MLPAEVLPLMLERGPGRRRGVRCSAQHHPRLAQRWKRAREAIGGAGDADLQARRQLLATREERCVSSQQIRVGFGGRTDCLCRSCYQALASVGSASWRVGQPVS